MTHSKPLQIIIVGCGRVGIELANSIAGKNHSVTVVDSNAKAFDRLSPDFSGRLVHGDVLDQETLHRAGIETADAFAAVTTSDSHNIIAAWIARDRFQVERVVARVYNPARAPIYEKLQLQTIASSSWGAQRIEQLILHPGLQSVCSAGNGEVQIYELTVPESLVGQKVAALQMTNVMPVAIARGGRGIMPAPDLVFQAHDILQVSATSEGVAALRAKLNINGREA